MDKIKVCVHDRMFHPDDVLCVTMLAYKYGIKNIDIIRSRKPEDWKQCDYILDVGGKDEINENQVWLDHHQKDDENAFYENGIKKAACGKLAEYLFGDDKQLLESMRNKFLYAVEADDNGQKPEEFGFGSSLFDFVNDANVTWEEDMSKSDEYFKETVSLALPIFSRTIEHIKAKNLALNEFNKALKSYDKEDRILVLNRYIPWEDYVVDVNKEGAQIATVCFKGSDGAYQVWSVPKEKGEFCPARLPKEWRGLRDEELQKVSGIKSAVFCFGPGCFFICNDKKDALRIAYLMIQEQIKEENKELQNINNDETSL